ncbi:ETS-related transcription factor Elf-4-like [Paramuricea clavata]|uniref:ETS-related transcription factor Elf-4-like n=1 Tax=Paramuricea clavata TaxID=317549 RepID=A0A7D9HYV6_PARCT|nr:ETS-related transcription factor Elf-4-like [Paramuricea clavata]
MANEQAEFRRMATRSSVYLWEFLLEVLEDQELQLLCYWIDKPRREFCVKDPEEIAKLWGIMKHRPFMDKKKLLRAIRYYYTSQLITKIPGKKFSYKFGEIPYAHPAFLAHLYRPPTPVNVQLKLSSRGKMDPC